MKHAILFVPILALVLAALACDAPGPANNPYAALAGADATRSAAGYILQATNDRANQIALQATVAAAQTQGAAQAEIDLINARATQTWSALAVQQAAAQATQAVADRNATATEAIANRQATATQVASVSQTAYPATATVARAQLNQIERAEREAQVRAYWREVVVPFQAVIPPLLVILTFILCVAGAVIAFVRILPALVLRLRTIRHGQRNEVTILLPLPDGRVIALLPDRSFGPGIEVGADGVMRQTGLAPNSIQQMQITSQSQAADLAAAMPPGYPLPLPGPVSHPQVEIIDAPGPHMTAWLDEVDEKLLTSGEEE